MSSQWNFEKMSDFYGVKDRLISAYMKQTGYNGDIPSEGFFRPRKTPESINILQGSVSQKVEDIMKMLGNNMEAFRGELLEL